MDDDASDSGRAAASESERTDAPAPARATWAAAGAALPALPGAVRARIALQALFVLAGLTCVACAAGIALKESGRPAASLGLVVGHVVAQGVTLSWVTAATLRFDAGLGQLMGWTLGLWPLRFIGALVGLTAAAKLLPLDQGALFGGFLATYVLGHVIEGVTLERLMRAARAVAKARAEASPPDEPSPAGHRGSSP